MAPSMPVFTGFDCNRVLIYGEHWERQLCQNRVEQGLGISAVLKTVTQSNDAMSNAGFEITGLGS